MMMMVMVMMMVMMMMVDYDGDGDGEHITKKTNPAKLLNADKIASQLLAEVVNDLFIGSEKLLKNVVRCPKSPRISQSSLLQQLLLTKLITNVSNSQTPNSLPTHLPNDINDYFIENLNNFEQAFHFQQNIFLLNIKRFYQKIRSDVKLSLLSTHHRESSEETNQMDGNHQGIQGIVSTLYIPDWTKHPSIDAIIYSSVPYSKVNPSFTLSSNTSQKKEVNDNNNNNDLKGAPFKLSSFNKRSCDNS
ncbi:hypothetical protein Glove_83g33 [Diversispora epigaea]|uniref:Uncharacterized protein n=1 Tax=Diversispora epigaea TaxID=1348612 RepID=A0A397J8C2_9GLOM|nr:hypothetical protein Glove_83g33 [Diversispora epigaea]